jgi:hypothetical protein
MTSKIVLRAGTIAASLLSLAFLAMPAQAQATRTWVSGVGDDANPCSRTAPCKTFAGAISKTATGGEINCLDPGGFGGVTITKSMQIICKVEAGVLVSGTNAIIVNGPANAEVLLEGLDIEGLGTGLNGVQILAANKVTVVNSSIRNFTQSGVNVAGPARWSETRSSSATTSVSILTERVLPSCPGPSSTIIQRRRSRSQPGVL